MSTITNQEKKEKILKFLYDEYLNGSIDNEILVSIIILLFDLLQLKTIAVFAKIYNKTYKGVSDFNKNIVDINGNKFVIDND